ncbi:MAG: carbohydrate porin [Thermosulfidibacteraceae bacterium]|jgi:porin
MVGKSRLLMGLILSVIFLVPVSHAYELSEKLSIEGSLSLVYQWLEHKTGDFEDRDRGAGVFELNVDFKPTDVDEFFLRGSVASRNALNRVNPFELTPYADDLSDDLHHINNHAGSWRNNLMEAWYKRSFKFSNNSTIGVTIGLIDTTRYIDENRFANDELTQFMNEVFVNAPTANLVSYDLGGTLEFYKDNFSLRVSFINSKTESGYHYNYLATQLGLKVDTILGEGNYRIYGFVSSEIASERLYGVGVSFDQDLIKDKLGAFLRAGWQNDHNEVTYRSFVSLGLSYFFSLLDREMNFGIGYSYLDGTKKADISYTHACEAYLKLLLAKYKVISSYLTFDIQYIKDRIREEEPRNREGWIYGIRWVTSF